MGFNFIFTFKEPSPKKKVVKKESNIVKKNVIGIIDYDIISKYYITIDDIDYLLSDDCYKCAGKNIFYSKYLVDNKFVKGIKLEKLTKNYSHYLPFRVGNIVIGNLVKEGGFIKFNIVKFDNANEDLIAESKIIQKRFINNYEQIKDFL